jgi:hypothetical protein
MAGSIYFDTSNYTTAVNGRYYYLSSYASNYPCADTWLSNSVEIDIVNGDDIITLAGSIGGADFFDLFGSNRNNADTIRYPYIIGQTGEILKVVSVLSSTTAKISVPCIFSTNTMSDVRLLDIYGQPSIVSTIIGNTSDSTVSGLTISTEVSYDAAVSIAPSQTIDIGTSPILFSLSGVSTFMLITF